MVTGGVRVALSLVFCVVFCRSLFVLFRLAIHDCVVCPSIYGFWLPIWYLQTLITQLELNFNLAMWWVIISVGFTYRLDRLKPRASRFRGAPAKVFNIFNTVIGLSHLCCHNVLYFLNNPSVIFLTQFQNMVEFYTPSSYLPLLKLIKHTSIFLQSWRWGIGRGLTSRVAWDLSLSNSGVL